jgi:polyphosphate glucokinase
VKILVIDVGGTHVKLLATGATVPIKIDSGPKLTPKAMVRAIQTAAAEMEYDHISIGFPAPVTGNRPAREPHNLGKGWVKFDYEKAFGHRVRMMNDAAMQALGSYEGGNMLFLGLGTGLGSAMIRDGVVIPLELAHLPYKHRTYEEYVGEAAMHRLGKRAWRKEVDRITGYFTDAFDVDYVVLGGGNAKKLKTLPPNARLGDNANAFKGGFRLWDSG